MRAHALEWLPAIPAQNAFSGAIGDRGRSFGERAKLADIGWC
jgi:hypothetical protein